MTQRIAPAAAKCADIFGKEIQLGDTVVYGVKCEDSSGTLLRVGRVVAIKRDDARLSAIRSKFENPPSSSWYWEKHMTEERYVAATKACLSVKLVCVDENGRIMKKTHNLSSMLVVARNTVSPSLLKLLDEQTDPEILRAALDRAVMNYQDGLIETDVRNGAEDLTNNR